MKNKFTSLIYIILFAQVSLSNIDTYGQNKIKVEEFPNLAKKITNVVPDGKALFVFEAKEDYQFDSDNENIVQPIKEGPIYKLYFAVETSSGAITILNKVADKATINYGRDLFENSLPALKSGEIRYFKLSMEPMFIKPKLEFSDITRQKKAEGAADLPTYNLRDALIIFTVVPKDLKIKIEGKKIDTVFKDATGAYKVYVHPEDQVLVLKSDNYSDESVTVGNLNTKDVRYYYVQQPKLAKGIEGFDANIKTGDYFIQSVPPGALIQMTGQPYFNVSQFKTPFTIKDQKSGTEIITLTLDRYESVTDTIIISSRKGEKNKSNYNLIEKFAFINCNIEPAFPISKIVMDGKELTTIKTGEDFECPKGIHTFEIVAPHYYTETRQINMAAGKTSEINIKLKPKMGSLTILPGENADNAEVFINEKNIGKLPIKNYQLQEGVYTVGFSKKGYGTEELIYTVSIIENSVTKMNKIVMLDEKIIKIQSFPTNAKVFINGKGIGLTDMTLKYKIGDYKINLVKENYDTLEENISIRSDNSVFVYTLVPSKILLHIKNTGLTYILIDKDSITQLYNIHLTKGNYLLEFSSNNNGKQYFKGNVSFPQVNNKFLPVYTSNKEMQGTILQYEYDFTTQSSRFALMEMGVAGWGLDFLKFKTGDNIKLVTSILTNTKFTIGGAFTRIMDIAVEGSVNYYYTLIAENKEKPSENKDKYRSLDYFYGLKFKSRLFNTGEFASAYLKVGMAFSQDYTQRVMSDFSYGEEQKTGPGSYFALTIGIDLLTTDNQILRLWHKPILANLRY